MIVDQKNAGDEEEVKNEEKRNPSGKSIESKAIILVVIVVLLLGGVGVGLFFMEEVFSPKKEETPKDAARGKGAAIEAVAEKGGF